MCEHDLPKVPYTKGTSRALWSFSSSAPEMWTLGEFKKGQSQKLGAASLPVLVVDRLPTLTCLPTDCLRLGEEDFVSKAVSRSVVRAFIGSPGAGSEPPGLSARHGAGRDRSPRSLRQDRRAVGGFVDASRGHQRRPRRVSPGRSASRRLPHHRKRFGIRAGGGGCFHRGQFRARSHGHTEGCGPVRNS